MSEDVIQQWKQQYGQIFTVSAKGVEYIFRSLTYNEYDKIVNNNNLSTVDAEDQVVETGLLSPSTDSIQYERIPAGVVSTLARAILDVSAFGNYKYAAKALEDCRERSSEVHNLMKAFIIATMPTHSEYELDNLTFEQLAHKVALAEQIISVNQATIGMEPSTATRLDLSDPEEEMRQQAQQAHKHNVSRAPGKPTAHDPIAERLKQQLE